MSALEPPPKKGTTQAIKSYIKENCNSYNSSLSPSLIFLGPQDVFPTVLPMLPRNKIHQLEMLAQTEEQNFIVTHTVSKASQTTPPPAFRERCSGLQRESFPERVESHLGPAGREKFRRGERCAFPKGHELEKPGTLMAETRAKVILLFPIC